MTRLVSILFLVTVPLAAFAVGEIPEDLESSEVALSVSHEPPLDCEPFIQLYVTAAVECPNPEMINVRLFVRTLGSDSGFQEIPMAMLELDLFQALIPARLVGRSGVEYYIEARMGKGFTSARSSKAPFQVPTGYDYRGEIPTSLPGDDLLAQLDPRLVPETSADVETEDAEEGKGHSSLLLQVVIVLFLATFAAVVYQRLGQG